MSGVMSVDQKRFEKLESTVEDIDKRMIPIELAIPSIDESLKTLTVVVNNQIRQDEWNKNTSHRQDKTDSQVASLSAKVEANSDKIIKIVLYLAAGAGGFAGLSKLLGL